MPPKLILRRNQTLSDSADLQLDKPEPKNPWHPVAAPDNQQPVHQEATNPAIANLEPINSEPASLAAANPEPVVSEHTDPDFSNAKAVSSGPFAPEISDPGLVGPKPPIVTGPTPDSSQRAASEPASDPEASTYTEQAPYNTRGFLVRLEWPSLRQYCDGLCLTLHTDDGVTMFKELLDGIRNHIFAQGLAGALAIVDAAHTCVEWALGQGSAAPPTRINRQNWPTVARTITDRGGMAVIVVTLVPDAVVRAQPDLHSTALLFVD